MKIKLSVLFLIGILNSGLAQFSDVSFFYEPPLGMDHCFPIDIDADGDNDLVMSLSDSTILGVSRLASPHVMSRLEIIPCSNHPISEFFSADVNADGVIDLLTYSEVNHRLTAYAVLENGWGEEVVLLEDMPELLRVQITDLDGDGNADITYATSDAVIMHSISAMMVASAAVEVVNPTPSITAYRFGNTDLDPDLDLVIGTTESIQVYPRNAQGEFIPGFVIANSENASRIELLHFAGTLANEIVFSTTSIRYCLNNGGNTFGASINFADVVSTNWSIDAFDGDGDGDLDLVWCAQTGPFSGYLSVRLNNGGVFTGSFSSFGTAVSGGQFRRLDMNGDGIPDYLVLTPVNVEYDDLAFICYHSSPITSGQSQSQHRIPYYPFHKKSSQGWNLELGDMDHDGDLDVVLASRRRLVWYPNDGNGQFTDIPVHIGYPEPSTSLTDPWLYDFDGDNDLDVQFGSTYMNDGQGNFIAESIVLPPSRYEDDLNYDGIMDFFTLTNTQARVWLGNSDGTHTLISANHSFSNPIVVSARAAQQSSFSSTKSMIYSIQLNTGPSSSTIAIVNLNGLSLSIRHLQGGSFYKRACTLFLNGDEKLDYCIPGWNNWGRGVNTGWTSTPCIMDPEEAAFWADAKSAGQVVTDIDGDAHRDVIFFDRQTSQEYAGWVEFNIVESIQTGHVFNQDIGDAANYRCGDLDMDGDPEIICLVKDRGAAIRRNLFNGNTSHGIALGAFHDINENGLKDEGESFVAGIPVDVSPGNYTSYTSDDGLTFIPRSPGTFELVPDVSEGTWSLAENTDLEVVLNSANPIDTVYLPLQATDAAVSLNIAAAEIMHSCDGTGDFIFIMKNGTQEPFSGQVVFVPDSSVIITETSFAVDSIVSGSYYWHITDLPPGESMVQTMGFANQLPELAHRSTLRILDEQGVQVYGQIISGKPCSSEFSLTAVNGYSPEGWLPNNTPLLVSLQIPGDTVDPALVRLSLPEGIHPAGSGIVYASRPSSFSIDAEGLLNVHMQSGADTLLGGTSRVLLFSLLANPEVELGVILPIQAYYSEEIFSTSVDQDVFMLYDCAENAHILPSATTLCEGDEFVASDALDLFETYLWSVDGEEIGFPLYFDDYLSPGFTITLNSDNVQCIAEDDLFVGISPQADFDCNGSVDVMDLSELLSSFACVETCSLFDLNADGVVNVADIVIFLGYM